MFKTLFDNWNLVNEDVLQGFDVVGNNQYF